MLTQCRFKKKTGLGQCRPWQPKEDLVVTPKTWHNCETCALALDKPKETEVKA
jgi:hypothetical protein